MKSLRSGQSIIEAMVAISILTVGLLGMLTLLTKSFQLTRVVNNETTATYLASEGIEATKSLIDHDYYSGAGWSNCFPFTAPYTIYAEIDYETYDCAAAVASPFDSTPYPIYFNYDLATGLHSYSDTNLGGTKTIFSRTISITAPDTTGNELDVQSTVFWTNDLGAQQSIVLEDHFYHYLN
jgi:hypothetical protein